MSATFFDRMFNSTILLPQQMILRGLRVARGDADFFSERGFADDALIPFLGMASDHQEDVLFDEVPELFGIRDASFATKLALNLATDPFAFTTLGATGAAKAAKAVNRIEGIAGKKFAGTLDDAIQQAHGLVQGGELPTKGRNKIMDLLRHAEKEAGELGATKLDELRGLAGEAETVIGLPFGLASNNFRIRVPVQHQGWVSVMADPFTKGAAAGIHGIAARNVPVLSEMMRPASSFLRAMSHKGRSRFALREAEFDDSVKRLVDERGGLEASLGRVEGQGKLARILLRKKIFNDGGELQATAYLDEVGKHEKRKLAPIDSARKLFTSLTDEVATADRRKANMAVRRVWKRYLGLAGLDEGLELNYENLKGWIGDFQKGAEADALIWEADRLLRPASGSFDQAAFSASVGGYEAGETLMRKLNKGFFGGTELPELAPARKAVRRSVASYSAAAEELNKLFHGVITKVATKTKTSFEAADQSISTYLQMLPNPDELMIIARGSLGIADPTQWSKFVTDDLPSFMNRMLDAANLLDNQQGALAKAMRRGVSAAGIDTAAKVAPEAGSAGRLRSAALQLQGWVQDKGAQGFLTEAAGEARGQVVSSAAQSPGRLLAELEDSIREFTSDMMTPVFKLAGDPGKLFMEQMLRMQRAHLKVMRGMDAVGSAVPLGHFPRILSSGETKRLDAIVGGVQGEGLKSVVTRVRAAHARQADEVTVESVNKMIDELRNFDLEKGGGTGAQAVIDSLVKNTPELQYRFSNKPHVALLASLGNMRRITSIGSELDDLISKTGKEGDSLMFGGEVIFHGSGNRTTFVRPEWKGKADEMGFRFADKAVEMPEQWVAVRSQRTGEVRVVGLAGGLNENAVIPVGKGTSVGNAAGAELAKRGKFSNALVTGAARATLDDVVGQQVLIGNKGVVADLAGAFGHQADHAPAWIRTFYDPLHAVLKAGATVVRPDFHLFNMLSGFPMLNMGGASMRNIFLGMLDAKAMSRQDPQFTDAASRMSRMLGDKQTGFQAIARQVRLSGFADDVLDQRKALQHIGDDATDIGEMFQVMAEEGLLNTHTRDITLANREVRQFLEPGRREIRMPSLEEFRDGITGLFGKGKLKDKAGKISREASELLSVAGDMPEVFLRVAGTRAFLREGYDLRSAVRSAKEALIDYSDFTDFEQSIMARGFSFYKFPRKMIPASLKSFARDPGKYVSAAKALYNMPAADASTGDLRANFGDYQVNLQRAIPQLDSVSAVASMADWLVNPIADLAIDTADASGSPERLPTPIGTAGVLSPAIPLSLFVPNGGERPSFGQVMSDAFRISYATRWALNSDTDPLAPQQTIFDQAQATIFGVKKPGEIRRQQWLANQYEFLRRDLETRIAETNDNDDRGELIREIERLGVLTSRFLGQ